MWRHLTAHMEDAQILVLWVALCLGCCAVRPALLPPRVRLTRLTRTPGGIALDREQGNVGADFFALGGRALLFT
jgi:hypothetical protein